MYIAHVDKEDLAKSEIAFHLNIPAGTKIPRPPFEVFASADNGYHGHVAIVKKIVGITRFHGNKLTGPFVSVDYIATSDEGVTS